MADDTPVSAPVEGDQPERATEQPTDSEKKSEDVTVSEDKPTETEAATEKKADAEAEADKSTTADAVPEAKADGETAEAAPADAEAAAPAEANGTPASAKKSSKNRRTSTGATQKLSRKKSQSRITHLDAKPGQTYLARLRSYAPWPAIICDEGILPPSLLETRPVTAMQKDGSYKGEYGDDGRRAHERTFPVMFFDTNEFAWVPNTNLTPLDPAECKNISEKNKSKSLVNAYKVASEGHNLQYFKKLLNEHQAAIDQEEAELEAQEAEKAAAKAAKEAKKGKRKSKGAETDVEMEDADDSKKSKAPSKKRKKDVETDAEAEKPAKTPKSNTKLKLTTPKAPAEDTGKKTPSKTKKAPAKKGKAAPAVSDEGDSADAKESEKPIDPEELRKKKEKESTQSPVFPDDPDQASSLYITVLFLRHKLQKGFISRDQPPKEDEMASMASYFDKLEKHSDLEVSIIRSTKINKVLKMIVKLNSIPRDEEFNFRHRAMNILSSWKNILDADTPGPADKDEKPAVNGSKEEDGVETPKLETEEEKEPESKSTKDVDSPMPDADEKAPEPEQEEKPEEKAVEEPTEEKSEEKSVEATA
ncbi:PWWP [Penicillium camemberti]|uniref:PWWP n=1 Tax=Penicillium camemberti (strain FM 013) TaxID=1429867 RepID=A0A0G4PR15_PENC3|nr:PWWP [Penicillium camemberti]